MIEEQHGVINRISRFLTMNRLSVLIVFLVATGIFSTGITRIKGEVILEEMLPYAHPYLKIIAKYANVFGTGGSGVAIAVRAKEGDIFQQHILKKVQDITNEVAMMEETYYVLTVSIGGRSVKVIKTLGDGEIKAQTLMWPNPPENDAQMAELKKNIYSDPHIRGVLASKDGTAALILTEFKENVSYERQFGLLQGIKERYSGGDTDIHMVGFPVLMGWIYTYKAQIRTVFMVSVALMVLILMIIFKNLAGMIAPIAVGLISTFIGLAFVGWTGLNFSPLLYVLAFLVGARAISHAVQVTHRYFEELYAADNDRIKACFESMRVMIVPNVAGVVTDAAGFSILILVKIALMQQVAIFMTFWMMSVGFSAVVTPIICSFIPLKKVSEAYSQQRHQRDLWDRINRGLASFCIGSGRYVLIAGIIGVLIFSVWQTTRIKIGDPTPGSPLLWPDHPYNRDQAMVDSTFDASSEALMLYYAGEDESVYDPIVLNTFEAFDRHMAASLPDIYKTSDSFMGLMKSMNMVMHDGDMMWRELPQQEGIMTGLIGWTKSQTDLYTMRRYFNDKMSMAQITLFFADHTSDNLLRIRNAAYEFFEDHAMKTEQGEFQLAGGRIGMEIAVNEEMKRTHAMIDIMVLCTICVLCALFYRSITAGLMLGLPLIIANLLAFAYMAVNNIGLSINTLPVAAVGVGVGVDFAIYIYNRCIEEYSTRNSWRDTILISVTTSGKAVVFTGLTMVLPILTWQFLSSLKFQSQMGLFLALILSINVLLSVTLHPLLIYLIKPGFITRLSERRNGAA